MGLALVGLEWMAGARSHDFVPPGIIAVQGATSLAADSGAGAVADAAGKGGAAVIGHVPGAAALATELVRRGVHTMVYDVNACGPGEWDALERAAARSGVRLRCGSHLARFAPVMAGVRDYAEGHVSVAATVTEYTYGPDAQESGSSQRRRLGHGSCGLDVCALAADVATATFDEAPQAVFASVPEGPDLREDEGEDEGAKGHVPAGAQGGHRLGVADHTAIMMRFSGGRAALLSIDSLPQVGCVIRALPPDIAYAWVDISGHGGHLTNASLAGGTIDSSWAAGMACGGLLIDGSEGRDEDGDDSEEWKEGSLGRYLPAMLAELETGEAPAWPPTRWSGVRGIPDVPPWWRAHSTWKAASPPRASLPPPSSLAHVMEAILVSINTGAPVYLDQR